jgi:hypothetical protein
MVDGDRRTPTASALGVELTEYRDHPERKHLATRRS